MGFEPTVSSLARRRLSHSTTPALKYCVLALNLVWRLARRKALSALLAPATYKLTLNISLKDARLPTPNAAGCGGQADRRAIISRKTQIAERSIRANTLEYSKFHLYYQGFENVVVLSKLFVWSTQSREVNMDYKVRNYVEFSHHTGGAFPAKTREVVARPDPALLEFPEGVYAFSFFEVLVATVEYRSEEVELESGRINETVLCFPDARILTLEEAMRDQEAHRYAISFMQNSQRDRCIITRDNFVEGCPEEFEILPAA